MLKSYSEHTRVILQGELSICGLDLISGRRALDLEYFVWIHIGFLGWKAVLGVGVRHLDDALFCNGRKDSKFLKVVPVLVALMVVLVEQ
jgi:hypothetical protein